MKRIPGYRTVDRALRAASIAVKAAFKEGNRKAAKLLARGYYTQADTMVAAVRKIPEFKAKLAALREEWRSESTIGGEVASRQERTPLWGYYKPLLQTIREIGGEATFEDLKAKLASVARNIFKDGDLTPERHGQPRWQGMLKRARRAMVKEGWLERRPSNLWRLTEEGRRASPTEGR